LERDPKIAFEWSEWYPWDSVSETSIVARCGVCEARRTDSSKRLTIGEASNLSLWVKQGLIEGEAPHSAGEGICNNEDTSGELPKHVKHM